MNDIVKFSATDLLSRIKTRELGVVEVLEAHLEVIDSRNTEINAIVSINPEQALNEARLADSKTVTGPLHGLPYAVKDTLATKDLRTTFGSLLFENNIPAQDALHVERARLAGAIVIGKTNTSEFSSGAQTDNALFGITRNPVDTNKTVTGSSGGSAAALAANMVAMADGSDLGGSLRSPASVCGVVGFRPTAGQVAKRNAQLPFDRLHVFGPMARCVEDIALFMSIFSGRSPECPLSIMTAQINYAAKLESNLSGLKIALSATPCDTNTHTEVRQVIDSHRHTFESLGCMVDDEYPEIAENHDAHTTFVALNAVSELGQYIHDERFARSKRLRMLLNRGYDLTPQDITGARHIQARCWQVLVDYFSVYDFLVWPTMAGLPYDVSLSEDEINEDWRPVELTPSLNLPAISLPAGISREGLPIGLQILGPPNSDFRLLQLAYGFQQAVTGK